MKAVSFSTCITQAKAFSTIKAILGNVTMLVVCSTQLVFLHLHSLSARGVFSDIIFYQAVQVSIGIIELVGHSFVS